MSRRSSMPFIAVVLALVAGAGAATWSPLGAQRGAADAIEDHFKYGSIGTEATVGVPFPLWRVLPIVFEDKLPARPGRGYERFGFPLATRQSIRSRRNELVKLGLVEATGDRRVTSAGGDSMVWRVVRT